MTTKEEYFNKDEKRKMDRTTIRLIRKKMRRSIKIKEIRIPLYYVKTLVKCIEDWEYEDKLTEVLRSYGKSDKGLGRLVTESFVCQSIAKAILQKKGSYNFIKVEASRDIEDFILEYIKKN
jgi:hypothetical protein